MRQAASRPLPRTLGLLAAPEYPMTMHSRSVERRCQGGALLAVSLLGRPSCRVALSKTSGLRCVGGVRQTWFLGYRGASAPVVVLGSTSLRTRVLVGALRCRAEPEQPGRRGISCVAAHAGKGLALRGQKTVWSAGQYRGAQWLCASAAWPNTSVKGTSCGKPQAAPYLER